MKNWFWCCQPRGPTALCLPQRNARVLVTLVCFLSVIVIAYAAEQPHG